VGHVLMDEFADATPLDDLAPLLAGDIPSALQPRTLASLLTPALLLASCGPGDPSAGGNPSADAASQRASVSGDATPTPALGPLTRIQASRLLGQASMGATAPDIARVQTLGLAGWIDEQQAMPREVGHWDWLVAQGYHDGPRADDVALMDMTLWRQAITAKDQLRQRIGMALLDIFAVGIDGLAGFDRGFTMAAYMDLLMDTAFGNFRALLEKIASSAAIAIWLTFAYSTKADPNTGTLPDENFAREVMQLFTIGLYQLNLDGTPKLVNGKPVESYTQTDITELAKVFTGWRFADGDLHTADPLRLPLILHSYENETGSKNFLGTTIPAGVAGFAARTTALDTLFAHPNVAPFISRQLIQRLVTSNPSPAYIGRVAAIFVNSGSDVRGDLKAVVRTILLDPEARNDAGLTSNTFGKLRAPVQRLTGWARACNATSPSGQWAIGDTSSSATRLAQSPGRSPSVFNFFRPGYTPPGSALATLGLVAPELQLANEASVVAYVNYMELLIGSAVYGCDVSADYASLLPLAADSAGLVDELNMQLAAGQLGNAAIAAIRGAVDSISLATPDGNLTRVRAAVLLVMTSPDYLVQK
jgi:uncharacterized protein (DUF1800 family)